MEVVGAQKEAPQSKAAQHSKHMELTETAQGANSLCSSLVPCFLFPPQNSIIEIIASHLQGCSYYCPPKHHKSWKGHDFFPLKTFRQKGSCSMLRGKSYHTDGWKSPEKNSWVSLLDLLQLGYIFYMAANSSNNLNIKNSFLWNVVSQCLKASMM